MSWNVYFQALNNTKSGEWCLFANCSLTPCIHRNVYIFFSLFTFHRHYHITIDSRLNENEK